MFPRSIHRWKAYLRTTEIPTTISERSSPHEFFTISKWPFIAFYFIHGPTWKAFFIIGFPNLFCINQRLYWIFQSLKMIVSIPITTERRHLTSLTRNPILYCIICFILRYKERFKFFFAFVKKYTSLYFVRWSYMLYIYEMN